MNTPNTDMSQSRTAQAPETVNVYDQKAGHYYDPACHTTTAPTPANLPGAPMPFANLRAVK